MFAVVSAVESAATDGAESWRRWELEDPDNEPIEAHATRDDPVVVHCDPMMERFWLDSDM